MIKKLIFGSFLALALSTVSNAQQPITQIRHMKDCPTATLSDPSLIARYAVAEGKQCLSWQSLYAIDDTFLGIRWHMLSNGTSTTGQPIEPDAKDIALSMNTCTLVGPHSDYIDLWFVPLGHSCDTRGDFDGKQRRIQVDDVVCNLPTPNCIRIDNLRPLGQQRAQRILDIVRDDTIVRSGKKDP